jgi:hypothetical protein
MAAKVSAAMSLLAATDMGPKFYQLQMAGN